MESIMKKEIFAVSIILVVIVLINIICQNYLSYAVDNIDFKLEEVACLSEQYLVEGDNKEDIEAVERMNSISDEWNKYEKILSLYIEHEELEKIDTSIVLIKSYISVDNYEDAIPEAKECVFILNHIRRKQKVSIANLF